MTERSSEQKRQTWTVRFGAAVALIVIGVGGRGFSSLQSALAGESQGGPSKAQRLPDDLVGVSDVKYASLDGLASGSQDAQERQRQAVQQLGLPLEVKTRKTGIVFRLIPAGSFLMGSPSSETDRDDDEAQHQVTLGKPFYCGKYEVTQGQWESVMGSNPASFKNAGRDAPVEQVSWEDCQAFLKKLCQMEGVPEGTYRLLTEAQWEYACRAGTRSAYVWGDSFELGKCNAENDVGSSEDKNVQSFRSRGLLTDSTMPVGRFAPNGWGLCDMHGNVWEWCQDWRGSYASGSVTDPLGPPSAGRRVCRGGGWDDCAELCRSAFRSMYTPGGRSHDTGPRLARTTPSYP